MPSLSYKKYLRRNPKLATGNSQLVSLSQNPTVKRPTAFREIVR